MASALRCRDRAILCDLPARPARSAGAGAFRARPRHAFPRSRLARALAVSVLAGMALLAPGDASAQTAAYVLAVNKVSADGTYNLGDTISVGVTFNAAVTVTGTPQLGLEIGTDTLQANYASGSSTQTLQFDYEVAAGNEDTDGIWVISNGLTLNGGTILSSGTAATLTHLHFQFTGILVDGGPALSTDATLSALSVSGATLSPAFGTATTFYHAVVANSVSQVTITDTTSETTATVEYLDGSDATRTDADTMTAGLQVNLSVGSNIVKVKVTAPDTTTTQTYTVNVFRAAVPVACSAASMTNRIWTGNLTAGNQPGGVNGYASGFGALDNTTFSYNSNAYIIDGVWVNVFGIFDFSLGTATLGTDAADVVLHIGTEQFALADGSYSSGTNTYQWFANVPTWADGDAACLALTADPPAIDSVALTSAPGVDSTYAISDTVTATVTFDAAVDIAGSPELELDFGGSTKAAACAAATNTTTMACSYTVAVGDEAAGGIRIGANKLTGDSIYATGITTLGADLDHGAVTIDAGHKVDGIRPTLVTTGDDAPRTSTDGTQVILTFSEDIGFATGLQIQTVAAGAIQSASFSGRTVTLTLYSSVTIAAGQTVTVQLSTSAVKDVAGNGNLHVSGTIAVINAVGVPAVSGVALTSAPGTDNTYAIGDTVAATVTFSEAVDISGSPELELDFGGTAKAAACATGTNTTTMACSYAVAAGDSAPNGIAIAADKLTGDSITATGSTTAAADLDHAAVAIDAGHKVDGIRPTLVTTGTDAPATSTDGETVLLVFSEDIGAVVRDSITIQANGDTVSTSAASVSGTKVEITLATALTAAATNITVALGADAVTDGGGNGNLALAATGVTNAVVSTTGPTVTGIALTSSPQSAFGFYRRNEDVEATVTFSEAVDITGSPQLELDFAGAAKAATCAAATNTTTMVCEYRVGAGDSAPNGIAIAANKLTGGTITATGSTTAANLDHGAVAIDADHKVDAIRPTLVTTGGDAPRTSTDGAKVILTFSEDIRSVNRASVTIQANGATLSTTGDFRTGNKAEITLATALTAAATNITVSLASSAVHDAAGNGILFVAATAVTNAVDAPDPADPPGSLKARRGDGEVHLEWEPPAAVAGDPDLAYQLRYGAEGGEYGQWRDIPGGPNARSHTVTGLENGTRYAFELRVRRRESGFGRAAEIMQTPEAPRWSVSTDRRSVHEGEDVTLSIATSNAVGFYSAPEPLTLAVIGEIVLESKTIDGADPEDFEIWVDDARVRGYTKDITFLNFDSDPDRDPFPAQHFDVAVPAGSSSLDVTVKALADDDEEEGQEHMSFMVFREDSLVNGDTWANTGVNIESGDAGVVKQLAVADAEATEGEDPSLDFVVTLAPAAAWTVRVDYATRDGTARAGSDYTATSGTLTFQAGDTAKTVSVPVTDDAVQDTPETLTLRLSNAVPPYDTTSVDWGSEEQGVLVVDSVATGTIRNTEDQAEPRTVSVSDASAAEGDSAVFTVSLSAASDGEVTVDYATSDGTAAAGSDYTATSGTLAFQAGEVAKTVSVPTTEDAVDDGGETFTLTLSNASGAGLGDAEATGTIRNTKAAAELSADFPESAYTSKRHTGSDDRPQVVVAFSEPVASFDGNTPSVTVTGASGLSVQTHTEDGLDNAYVFFMTPDGDGDVTFTLVADAACASGGICTAGGTVLTQVPAALTVPGPGAEAGSLSVADAEATEEEEDAMEFVVTLDPAAVDAVTVDYATSDGTATAGEDYTATSGALTFTAGEVTKTISVPITDDAEDDGGETFTLTLSNASGADLDDATATGTINDDDESPPAVSVSDASAAEGDAVEFTVSLSAASDGEVTVEYATSDGTAAAGSDYTAASGTLTFAANETTKTVSVATTDDSVAEEDETFTLALSSPANATLGDATATGTINDNDVSTTSLTASFSDMPASHTGGEFTFGLTFSENVELGYVTLRDTAFVVTGGEVKTAQRQRQGSNQAWNITVEPSGQGAVTITLPETTDCGASGAICTGDGRPLSHSLSATVAGPAGIPAVSVSDASAAEGDAVAFTVSLSAAADEQVTVQYATSGGTATSGTDFTAESGTLTFGANATSKTVSVATTDDSVDEEDETFTLTLSSPANATLGDATATGTINDNDESLPAVSVSDGSAAEGDAVAFAVSLSAASSRQVTVDYATSGGTATSGTDFTAESGTLTFAANETSKTVSVATTDDSVDEDDETFTLTLSSPVNAALGDATATGTINDNDDDDAAPLTASFSGMPASHSGAEFTFRVAFSEDVDVSYRVLRDSAFVVTGGDVRQARRVDGRDDLREIHVEPTSATDTVTVTLPETTDCNATGAICTGDGRPLSHSLSATVAPAASASASVAESGDVVEDALALADGVTPEEATRALFGERRLSEAQLTALDRLGNRNGGYDLGDVLSWIERCRRGEARCGRSSTDPGPAGAAALLGAAAAGRRRTSKRPGRGDSGRRGRSPVRGMRRRARKAGCALAMLLAAAMAWSCTDGSAGPAAPAAAVRGPGFLTVEWTGPAAARDIGVLIELEGPGIETVRAPGLDLYESSAPGPRQVVVAGTLRAGALVEFRVPDRGQLSLYRVRVVQVTGEDYALRDPGEYRAVITLR